jgi:hypothetical protein
MINAALAAIRYFYIQAGWKSSPTEDSMYGYGASFSDTADASRNKIPVCAINTGAVIDGISTSSHITLYP